MPATLDPKWHPARKQKQRDRHGKVSVTLRSARSVSAYDDCVVWTPYTPETNPRCFSSRLQRSVSTSTMDGGSDTLWGKIDGVSMVQVVSCSWCEVVRLSTRGG